ncbi:MAG TPA: hypothetical protein VND87_03820 [Stellaceae bacterium]|nr:hypothetical protein [Stellaceae bacterium]
MAQHDPTSGDGMEHPSDKAVWEYCRAIDCETDEAERFLDLAGFVDARLDSDERERVAALLIADPAAASDVAAAPALTAAAATAEVSERLIARAVALLGEAARGQVVPFAPRARPRPTFTSFARWGSVAAAIMMASWLGFALGTDASTAYDHSVQPSQDGFLGDLLDPSGGILHTITDGLES